MVKVFIFLLLSEANRKQLGMGRQVQDRSFFFTELRHKISLITSEIGKMNAESEQITKDNTNFATFENR